MGNSRRGLLFFMAVYAAALAFLLPVLSLWLDEILTLAGARQPDFASVISYLKAVPGGTPLSLLAPAAAMRLFGDSDFAARLSSALASLATLPGIFWLGRRMGLRSPLLGVAVFALCQMQFRYAMEARPYALALCLSVWATVVFLALLDRPWSAARRVLYVALTLAGGYTLAYSLAVPGAHLAWLVLAPSGRDANRATGRRLRPAALAAIAVTGAALLAWYLYMRAGWAEVVAEQRLSAILSWGTPLMVLHELTGAGYFGSVLLVAVGAWGLWRNCLRGELHSFWFCYTLLPALLIPAADLMFGYFFAVRQMIYILAPLSLLFVAGAEAMGRNGRYLIGLFLAVSLYADLNWMTRPREDWRAAAAEVQGQLSLGGCMAFVGQDAEMPFTYSHPRLGERRCSARSEAAVIGAIGRPDRIVLAVSPYDPRGDRANVEAQLAELGYQLEGSWEFSGPVVEAWRR